MGKEASLKKEQMRNNELRVSLAGTRKRGRELLLELGSIKQKEEELIKKINLNLRKDDIQEKRLYLLVKHFTFNDFAQIVIGACVFSLAPFLDTDPWNYLPYINTKVFFLCHVFFMLCVFIALNYEYRSSFRIDPWFFTLLLRRFFYTYFSVLMIATLILILVNRISYNITILEVFRNYLAVQSVGLFGAATFSFLKK